MKYVVKTTNGYLYEGTSVPLERAKLYDCQKDAEEAARKYVEINKNVGCEYQRATIHSYEARPCLKHVSTAITEVKVVIEEELPF